MTPTATKKPSASTVVHPTPEAGAEPLAAKLAELDSRCSTALAARREAEDNLRKSTFDLHDEVTRELREWQDDVAFSKRKDDPAERRRLSVKLAQSVIDRGLTFLERGDLLLVDPAPTEALDAAVKANHEAVQERADFYAENTDALRAEAEAARSARFVAAVSEGDLETVKEVLA